MMTFPCRFKSAIRLATSASEFDFCCCLSRALIVLVSVETLRGRDAPRFLRSARTKSIAAVPPLPFGGVGLAGDEGGFVLTAAAG